MSATARPTVVAHRGASADAPENTLAAIDLAARHGADVVEVDARLCADGTLAVVHDDTLERTTDCAEALPGKAPWRVAELTAADLAAVRAGVHDGVPQPIPTLEEVIDRTRALGLGLLVELKPAAADGALEAAVAAALHAVGDDDWLAERVLLASFDAASLDRAGEAVGAPRPQRALILAGLVAADGIVTAAEPATPGLAAPGMALAEVREAIASRGLAHLGLALLGLSGRFEHDLDAATVAWFRDGGVELNVFANTEAQLAEALALDLASVLTDHPGRAVALRAAARG
ncbi:MAG: glycerophosphodiester phosphodiesterase family protein [Egibacteraceae bacterium]